ncbi:MAG: DUF1844 domain-containing protein [Phycisphaerae bacterium]|nr:DUF1844 domain-containing protein [Phycisphaerae bacterium]
MAEEQKDEQQPKQQGAEGAEQSKIYVDDDWKAQAQAEKEKLARETEQKAQEAGAAGAGDARDLPPASFTTLVNSLAAQAIMALGGMEDPQSGRRYVDLDLAKHHIDTLKVLEDKAQGNLDDAERKALDQALYQVRMIYVQIAQQLSGAGPAPPTGSGAAGGGIETP